MTQTCETVTRCDVLVPGTGVFVPTSAQDWESHAITQLDPVDIYGSWRFAFDPVQGSAFITGVFDSNQHTNPRPSRYVISVEFKINEYRTRYQGVNSAWMSWSGERLALQGMSGTFKLFADGTEVWSS